MVKKNSVHHGIVRKNNVTIFVGADDVNVNRAVAHYMPPRFPLMQRVEQDDVDLFAELWDLIYNDSTLGPGGETKLSGLFNVFYTKLFDRSAKFHDYFGDNYKERCGILTRQMVFFTTLTLDDNIDAVFRDLGIMHQRLGIANWQYSMFVEVLLECIYSVLGEAAVMKKMLAATRVISFCLYKLLQATIIPSRVRPLEMNVNYVDHKVESIIDRLDEQKDIELAEKLQVAAEQLSSHASLRSANVPRGMSTTQLEAPLEEDEENDQDLDGFQELKVSEKTGASTTSS